ncbi:fiber [Frog adenovirus 1]|uniref:Fiber n=1 Tax=Frog adenovirus 1 (strain ATCC VR-896) TaxID=114102 RepID=Q9IIG6_ADEF1|nr:fiber [Frog adenovirus 1]AAF86941.1 fiber [Frog adenovirus 1]
MAQSSKRLRRDAEAAKSDLNLVYPFFAPKINITPPFINVGEGLDVSGLTLRLKIGAGLTFNSDGELTVIGGDELKVSAPLMYQGGVLALNKGSNLFVQNGDLFGPIPSGPLYIDNQKMSVKIGDGLKLDGDQLALYIDPVFSSRNGVCDLNTTPPLTKSDNKLSVSIGNGLKLDGGALASAWKFKYPLKSVNSNVTLSLGSEFQTLNNELRCKLLSPLSSTSQGIALDLGAGLQLKNNRLTLAVSPPFSSTGGLSLLLDPSLRLISGALGLKPSSASCIVSSPAGVELKTGKGLGVTGGSLELKLAASTFSLTSATGQTITIKLLQMDSYICISFLGSVVLQAADFNVNDLTLLKFTVNFTENIDLTFSGSAISLIEFGTKVLKTREMVNVTFSSEGGVTQLSIDRTTPTSGSFDSVQFISTPFFAYLQ